MAQQLLDRGADVNVQTSDGKTPLHFAVELVCASILQLLMDKGADVNIQAKDGRAALHYAVQHGGTAMAQQLLDWGADLRARTNAGATPEDLSTYGGMTNMLRAAATRRERCEAFAMGHHERLGATSLLRGLDLEVLRIILEQA